jgi:hypothetical protein
MKLFNFHRRWSIGILGLLCFGLAAGSGCNDPSSTSQSAETEEAETELPKLLLHLPKTGTQAVDRMKELVAGLTAEGSLPAPYVYTVREIIHGSGASAHSHYYRENPNEEAPNFDHDDHDDHEMESSEKTHEVSVDPLEELRDLAYGIPKIAAKGDIDESGFNTIRKVSKEMTGLLGRHNDKTPLEEKREQIRAASDQFEAWIAKIEGCVNAKASTNPAEGN